MPAFEVAGMDAVQVLTFRSKAWSRFAPPTRRMSLGPYQGIARARPAGRVTPRFRHQLSTLLQRFACTRLPRPCLPGSLSRRFRNAHHHGFWPQQLTVAWDRFLIAEPKGPPSSLEQLRITVWTGDARDTRPKAEVAGARMSELDCAMSRPQPDCVN